MTDANVGPRLLRAWLLTGVVDFLFASAQSVYAYRSTFARLWQGVASVPLGAGALQGGTRTVAIGILLHFGVALLWSALFVFVVLRWAWVRRVLASPFGVLKIAALYGPFIWLVMSAVLIPAFTHRAPVFGFRWWVQLVAHIPFVATPLVAMARPEPAAS